MAVELANAAAKSGYRASVCVTRKCVTLAAELRSDVQLFVLRRRWKLDPIPVISFRRLLDDQRVDLLHVHGRSSLAFTLFVRTLLRFKQPVVFHDHTGSAGEFPVPWWMRIPARRMVCKYVAVAEGIARAAQEAGVSAARIAVISNALDLERLAVPSLTGHSHLSMGSNRILKGLYIGSIQPRKGLDIAIRALARLRTGGEAVLTVAGRVIDASYATLCRRLAGQLDAGKQVEFLGERGDIMALTRDADFAVVPSRSESGPLVLIEFLAAGLPVVASNSGNIAELAGRCNLPGMVEADNESAFAAALQELTDLSAGERKERGEIGRRIAWEKFSMSAAFPKWMEIYESAAKV
jgi:glycosyltransferase involved in cell wall biosynthesis